MMKVSVEQAGELESSNFSSLLLFGFHASQLLLLLLRDARRVRAR